MLKLFVSICLLICLSFYGCKKEEPVIYCWECHNREMPVFHYCGYTDEEMAQVRQYWMDRKDTLQCDLITITEYP